MRAIVAKSIRPANPKIIAMIANIVKALIQCNILSFFWFQVIYLHLNTTIKLNEKRRV